MRIPFLPCEKSIYCAWWSQLLITVAFRLNSRDHVRERRSISDKAENGFSLSSFRVAQGASADKSRTKPTAVSISVHHSETTDFAEEVKHNEDIESATAELRRTV